MHHYTLLKVIYILFLGIMLALFVGVVTAAVYPGPKAPEISTSLTRPAALNSTPTPQELEDQKKQDDAWKEYQTKQKKYDQNVSIISLVASIIMLIISLVLANKIDIISDGILLGSVLTLFYSIIRGFTGENELYRLLVVTIGLIIAFILGYTKFIRPEKS